MKIRDLFKKDIFRPINGVVKADQLDPDSVWQELDEFVVTRELEIHFREFFTAYCNTIDNPNDPTISGKIGVWISGFFGSGKSHFIKVLAYLLQNMTHTHNGESKRPIEFFESKIKDPMLLGDIKRAVASKTDVFLFNIDSKADTKSRDAILSVFLKVLNEAEGYCPDHPHIAHMERYLDSKGKLEVFQNAFQEDSGSEWNKERDAYQFNHDSVIKAWMTAAEQSKEAAEKWIDGAEESFSLTVENFSKWVKEYLEKRDQGHRVIFLVDEVGQFIGSDTHLMLNLQTITENLGTVCHGRAWVAVTSQEDIDAVLGEMRVSKANDFSKIQGRFRTRLSLSGANVDEVIQERLLKKQDSVTPELIKVFSQKGDILKNQLTFGKVGMTFRQFRNPEDFAKNYPFAPYQFQLVQKIFEAIRKAGATGLHLSKGERSMLDAFQSAGKAVAEKEIGVLVPLYEFYPSIESFLDTAVKKTIDQASDNTSLKPFDVKLLQVLFLIRYVDEIKGSVDNLATLCLDEIDADKLELRRKIEEGLQRLENETLINRSGDNYFFLTNEERDISREIKNTNLSGGEEPKLIGELIFDDVFKGVNKHRYAANKMDFSFNRICDYHPVGHKLDGALNVSVVTPLSDDYKSFGDSRAVLVSSNEGGQVIIWLEDNEALGREMRTFLKTDKYLRTRDDGTLPQSTRRIHRDLAEENRERREGLSRLLEEMLTTAKYFAAGQKLTIKASIPAAVLDEAIEYLIKNTFSKMNYIEKITENPLKEIQAILKTDDLSQPLLLRLEETNKDALKELKDHIELSTKLSHQIVVQELLEKKYSLRPYGWPDLEVIILISRLLLAGEINLMMDSSILPREKAYEPLTTPAKRKKLTIIKKKIIDSEDLKDARNLGKEVFSKMGPDGEESLFGFLTEKLGAWQIELLGYQTLANTGDYPGNDEIRDGLHLIKNLLGCDESYKFIQRFNENKTALLELSNNYHDLDAFYKHQKPVWEKLRKARNHFNLNRYELKQDERSAQALVRIDEILAAKNPYSALKEADNLIAKVEKVNSELISERRSKAEKKIIACRNIIEKDLDKVEADQSLRDACFLDCDRLISRIKQENSLAHIAQMEASTDRLIESAQEKIERSLDLITLQPGVPPKLKPTKIVHLNQFLGGEYLESQDGIEDFLNRLRNELEAAIAKGERVRIK